MALVFRCLVGDPSAKSYGDVAFMDHHNLESNIECEMVIGLKKNITTYIVHGYGQMNKIVFSETFVVDVEYPVTIITYLMTLCSFDGQI